MRTLLLAFLAVAAATTATAQTPPPAPAVPVVAPDNILNLDLSTGGRVTIAMRPDIAPKHVERIRTLVRQGFYDGTIFHRVIDGFMAQGGDPTGTGTGGSKLPNLKAEFNDLPHVRGAVAMARAGDTDSANSQFYICLAPALKLDHNYTVWGRVTSGMEFVDAIEKGEPPANPSKIVHASIGADGAVVPAIPAGPASAGVPITTVPVPAGTPGAPLGARQSAPVTAGPPPVATVPPVAPVSPVPVPQPTPPQ